jgi:hypothetical protein
VIRGCPEFDVALACNKSLELHARDVLILRRQATQAAAEENSPAEGKPTFVQICNK